MGIKFGSKKWIKALQEEINNSEAYAKTAAKWEGDFCFEVELDDDNPKEIYLYLDLWHGECRSAKVLKSQSTIEPAFIMKAPITTWRGVFEKELNPIKALVANKLALKGNKLKIIRSPKMAFELELCCRPGHPMVGCREAYPGN